MVSKYARYMVKNYLFFIITTAFIILYCINMVSLPAESTDFPRALMFIIVPLFLWNLINSIQGFRKLVQEEKEKGTVEEKKLEPIMGVTLPRVVVTLVTIAYVFVLPILGFILTSVLYLVGLTFYLGIRKPITLAIFAAIYVAVLYGIFVMWLHVRLPVGIFMIGG